ncbi:MAG: Helix-turn-helix domain [Actinomycetota bacterium]|jgi:excisionase family DNA binding protein|nr:Helix-turn-helix domain [Actinomycetota bacterium]
MAKADQDLTAQVQGPLLLPAEAAALLRVSIHNIYRNARLGRIPSIRVGGLVRFDREELLTHVREAAAREVDQRARARRTKAGAARPTRGDGGFSFKTPKRSR